MDQDASTSPRARTRAYNVLFFFVVFLIAFGALAIWARMPMAAMWIGIGAIMALIVVGAVGLIAHRRQVTLDSA